MPVPSSPPYGVGSTPPRQLDRWLDINSQNGPLTRTRGYVSLPPFSFVANVKPWADIVGVYNYNSSNSFSIKGFKKFTNNGSYSLCIAYANADLTVKRYMLVKGTGDNNLAYIPMYNGETIKKNFRLELWIPGQTLIPGNLPVVRNVHEDAGIQMFSTVLGPLDYRYGLDFVLGSSSVLCTSQNTTNTLQFVVTPPSNVTFPLRIWLVNWQEQQFVTLASGSKVAFWQGQGFNDAQYVSPVSPSNQPDFFLDYTPGTQYRLQFFGQQYLTGINNNNLKQLFIAFAPNVGGNNTHQIFKISSASGTLTVSSNNGYSLTTNFNGNIVTTDYSYLPTGQIIVAEIDIFNEKVNIWDGYTAILKTFPAAIVHLLDSFGNFITDENGNRITITL